MPLGLDKNQHLKPAQPKITQNLHPKNNKNQQTTQNPSIKHKEKELEGQQPKLRINTYCSSTHNFLYTIFQKLTANNVEKVFLEKPNNPRPNARKRGKKKPNNGN